MPLFVCDECKAIENTALGQFWTRGRYGNSKEALCSECMPYVKIGHNRKVGEWHRKFPKQIATTELIKQIGEEHFVYVSDIEGVEAKSPGMAPKKK